MIDGANLFSLAAELALFNHTHHKGATKLLVVGFIPGMYRAASHIGEAGRLAKSADKHRQRDDHLPGNRAANSLEAPSVGVFDVSNFVQQERSVEPGPGELPGDRRPPFPASTTFHGLLLFIIRLVAPVDKAEALMKLARDDEDNESTEELH